MTTLMAKIRSTEITTGAIAAALLLCLFAIALSQTPGVAPAGARGVIRLSMKVKVEDPSFKLQRKRFYLIKGSLEQNKDLFAAQQERNKILLTTQREVISRDCYYKSVGASEKLAKWLKKFDCETVYCREVEPEFVDGPNAVPEFTKAVDAGASEKQFGNRELARKWLAVNMTEELRSGFYKRQKIEIDAFIKRAEDKAKAIEPNSDYRIISMMTDRLGFAYFTDIKPGTYVITNILPMEAGSSAEFWKAEVTVTPGDLITDSEKLFTISNYPDAIAKDPRKGPKIAPEKLQAAVEAYEAKMKKLASQISEETPLPTCSPANK